MNDLLFSYFIYFKESVSSSFTNTPGITEHEKDSLRSELNDAETDRIRLQYKMAANDKQQMNVSAQLADMTNQRDTLQSNLSEVEIK